MVRLRGAIALRVRTEALRDEFHARPNSAPAAVARAEVIALTDDERAVTFLRWSACAVAGRETTR